MQFFSSFPRPKFLSTWVWPLLDRIPVEQNETAEGTTTMLYRVLWLLFFGNAILMGVNATQYLFNLEISNKPPGMRLLGFVFNASIGLSLLLAQYWVVKGLTRRAIALIILHTYLVIFAASVLFGAGIYNPILHLIYVLMIMASVFSTNNSSLWVATGGTILVYVLFYTSRWTWGAAQLGIPALEDLGIIVIGYWGAYFLLRITIKQIYAASNQLRDQTKSLEQNEGELIAYQTKLEEMVAQRTSQLLMERNKAERANQAKSVFLTNMSHELRTPLNAIIGYSELIDESLTDTEGAAYEELGQDVGRISTSGRHLLDLINNLLDLSRIEAERVELHLTEIDVETLIDRVTGTMRPLIQKQNNYFEIILELDHTKLVTDGPRLRQILLNLLSNAAKFTSDGIVTFKVTQDNANRLILFEVSDTGIGIDQAFIPKLFDPFEQEDNSTTRKHAGTGLGLAITEQFCKLLGASIEVESRKAVGSCFVVKLPL
ncbi:MAG: signal transduction histidine kinase [Cellvibrionaceae bacterium]|jgi:signal transduction histidine kinase